MLLLLGCISFGAQNNGPGSAQSPRRPPAQIKPEVNRTARIIPEVLRCWMGGMGSTDIHGCLVERPELVWLQLVKSAPPPGTIGSPCSWKIVTPDPRIATARPTYTNSIW
jgi:hypothetical protein